MTDRANTRLMYVCTPHHQAISPTESICLLANAAGELNDWSQAVVVFSARDAELARQTLKPEISIYCFEHELAGISVEAADMARLERDYPSVFFGNVVAGERVFTDFSFLMGALGFKRRSAADIWSAVAKTALFFEKIYREFAPEAVVSFVPDNFFSDVSVVMAEALSIKLLIPQIAQLAPDNQAAAGFWGRTRYLESYRFMRLYRDYASRPLSETEQARAAAFIENVRCYDPKNTHKLVGTAKLRAMPLSPRWRGVLFRSLMGKNSDSIIDYAAPEFGLKAIANIRRIMRFYAVGALLSRRTALPPKPYVYLPLHLQPEASSLIHGLYSANQIALIEQISKSLPLGYLLVVKEHEKGRGNRPLWQYKYIESLYNVRLCDRPSAEILRECEAVLTITGTVAVEAVAHRKPAIIFGRKHYFFPDFFYRCYDYRLLPAMLKEILLERRQVYTEKSIAAYFLAWADSQIDVIPTRQHIPKLAPFIKPELEEDYSQEIQRLSALYSAQR